MKYDHNFKKKFGQNFITHVPTILKVIDLLDLSEGDKVLEIGPGDGRFTEAILQYTQNIDLVEIDKELVNYLSFKFEDFLPAPTGDSMKIHSADILDFDLSIFKDQKLKVFGALPYNISKPIIAKFLETNIKPERMVFITQKEVAEDYGSVPPKAHFLSNYARLFADVEYHGKIDKQYFQPQPKVHGGILRFIPNQENLDEKTRREINEFKKFIRIGYRNPRKKLTNSLKTLYKDVDWNTVLEQAGLGSNVRAAELSLDEWGKLYSRYLS